MVQTTKAYKFINNPKSLQKQQGYKPGKNITYVELTE